MKRLVASRKLKRTCIYCNRHFNKGEVYYKKRTVFAGEGFDIVAHECLVCPKCKYKAEKHAKRFEDFKTHCIHPNWAIETQYHYMAGECVMEPDYDYCSLCGAILGG